MGIFNLDGRLRRRVSPEFLEQLSGRQKSQHHHRLRRGTQNERRSLLAKNRNSQMMMNSNVVSEILGT